MGRRLQRLSQNADGGDLPAQEVFASIFGDNYDRDTFKNACATRVSLGLLAGGMKVFKSFNVDIGIYKDKGIMTSASGLRRWLSKIEVWGPADTIIKNSNSFKVVSQTIASRNGVYIVEGGFSGGVTGHATLWVGANNNAINGSHYADIGGTIYFWELK